MNVSAAITLFCSSRVQAPQHVAFACLSRRTHGGSTYAAHMDCTSCVAVHHSFSHPPTWTCYMYARHYHCSSRVCSGIQDICLVCSEYVFFRTCLLFSLCQGAVGGVRLRVSMYLHALAHSLGIGYTLYI